MIAAPRLTDRVDALLARYTTAEVRVAALVCDEHPPDAIAFTIVDETLQSTDLSYRELRTRSEAFAAVLRDLGVGPGDRIATLMSKSADLVTVIVGAWRVGAVLVPLFTAFAAPAIRYRLTSSEAKVVVVDAAQRAKLEPAGPGPAPVVLVSGLVESSGDLSLAEAMRSVGQISVPPIALPAEAPIICLYTSGTTGNPKGVLVPVRALASLHAYLEFGLDVRPDDVYWNAADPGWAYGLFYAITAPLAAGRRSLLLSAGFSAPLTWSVLERFKVTNFAAAPTVFRALRAADAPIDPTLSVRVLSSAGEPLNPDVAGWAKASMGVAVLDHYGQTELGMCVANAHHPQLSTAIAQGSMGHPLPGWTLQVLDEADDAPAAPGRLGRLAVDVPASPFMWFQGYDGDELRTRERYCADGRWYLTGDTAYRDEDGNLFFRSRGDDLIIMAGYRIGPDEIESVLLQHDRVLEAAVVAAPDALRGEVVEAFVVLRPGVEPSAELIAALKDRVKQGFAAHAYPRTIHFVAELPRTPSGKLQRSVLRLALHEKSKGSTNR